MKVDIKTIRSVCVKFVKDNFPKTLNVSIDGAKPRRGVKVISKDGE
jgi:hypothetical protein